MATLPKVNKNYRSSLVIRWTDYEPSRRGDLPQHMVALLPGESWREAFTRSFNELEEIRHQNTQVPVFFILEEERVVRGLYAIRMAYPSPYGDSEPYVTVYVRTDLNPGPPLDEVEEAEGAAKSRNGRKNTR